MIAVRKEAGIHKAQCRADMAVREVMVREAVLIMMSTVLHAMAHRAAIMDKVVTALLVAAHKATGIDNRADMVLRQVVVRRAAIAARAVTVTATIAAA